MNYKHGDAKKGKVSRLWTIWNHMKHRCADPNNLAYKYYGGKGISVCREWLEYSTFRAWAWGNGYNISLTIDRRNSNGNYEPGNCEWIPRSDNCRKAQEKFTAGEAVEIRKIIKSGKYSNRRMSRAYNVSHVAINDMANNKTYKEELCPK